jgi:predicted metal-binding protein
MTKLCIQDLKLKTSVFEAGFTFVNFTVDVKTVLCEFFVFEKCGGVRRRRIDLGNILTQNIKVQM